jgi:hypothetical protein
MNLQLSLAATQLKQGVNESYLQILGALSEVKDQKLTLLFIQRPWTRRDANYA